MEIPSSPQELPDVLQPLTFYCLEGLCLYCHANDARFHPQPAHFPRCLRVGACSPPPTPEETQAVGRQAGAGAHPRLPCALATRTQPWPRRHLREGAECSWCFCQRRKVGVYKRYRILQQEKMKNKNAGFKNVKVGILLLTADEMCVCVLMQSLFISRCTAHKI